METDRRKEVGRKASVGRSAGTRAATLEWPFELTLPLEAAAVVSDAGLGSLLGYMW